MGFIKLVLIIYVLQASFLIYQAQENRSLPPVGRSFRLTSILWTSIDRVSLRYQVEEVYSAEQRRSKITYRLLSGDRKSTSSVPNEGTFYISSDYMFLYDKASKSCRQSSVHEINELLNLKSLDPYEQDPQLWPVGPSKVFQYLKQNKYHDSLEPGDYPSIRGRPTEEHNTESQITVNFAKFTIDGYRVPIMFSYRDKEKSLHSVVIRFRKFAFIDTRALDMEGYLDVEAVLGESTMDTTLNCPVTDSMLRSPFRSAASYSRLSFLAEVKSKNTGGTMSAFVAYDNTLRSLRVDKTSSRLGISCISNFEHGLVYHIIKPGYGDDLASPATLNFGEKLGSENFKNGRSCIVTESAKVGSDASFVYNHIIAGAHKFIYLGRAIIRGIKVKVYEAQDTMEPLWLSPDLSVSDAHHVSTKISSTVVYVADVASDREDDKVVLIELYDSKKTGKTIVSMFDFSLELSSGGTDGSSLINIFTPADSCISSQELNNRHAKVDLILTIDRELKDGEIDWLQVPSKRNMAILAGLQASYRMPASMVYDLQSTFSLLRTGDDKLSVQASMQVFDPLVKWVDYEFRFIGRPKSLALNDLILLKGVSLRACFMRVAHRKRLTYFAYNRFEGCLIFEKEIGNSEEYFISDSEEGPWSVYSVVTSAKGAANAFPFLKIAQLIQFSQGRGKETFLKRPFEFNTGTNIIPMITQSFKVTDLSRSDYWSNEISVEKFVGFGLLETDAQSRRLYLAQVSTRSWGPGTDDSDLASTSPATMSLAQCQMACLSDPDCESYSICIKEGRTSCVLSRFSLRRAEIIAKLNRLAASRPKRLGETIKLELNDGTAVGLERHPTCELHNKIYLQMFEKVHDNISVRIGSVLYSVEDREQCAKLCHKQTIKELNSDLAESKKSTWTESDEGMAKVKQWTDSHWLAVEELCSSFHYLDRAKYLELGSDHQSALSSKLVETESEPSGSLSKNGFCLLSNHQTKPDSNVSRGSKQFPILYEMYEFKFLNFYEVQHRLALKPSELNEDFRFVFHNSKHYFGPEEESYTLMRDFLMKGNNIQRLRNLTPAECARACFLKISGILPACASFDIVVDKEWSRYSCRLNSITLKQAVQWKRFDLIDHDIGKDSTIKVWHYEPKPGFIEDELEWEKKLELAMSDQHGSQVMRLQATVTSLIVIAGLLIGIMLGIGLGRRYQTRSTDPNLV